MKWLWGALLLWLAVVTLPLWERYIYWIAKNFGKQVKNG